MLYENDVLVNEFLDANTNEKIVDLESIIPIGRIEIEGGDTSIFASYDNEKYDKIINNTSKGKTARYIKIEKEKEKCSKVTIYVGAGYIASKNNYWGESFKRYEGWTGADGIYSMNITNGKDYYNNMEDTKTLFFFSDTLISKVDKKTLKREEPIYMPNNTYAILDGEDPQKPGALEFFYKTDENGKPIAFIEPTEDCFDFKENKERCDKSYYWLQDGVVLGDKIYFIPIIITEDKSRREGFQFRLVGTSIAEADIINEKPDFDNIRQYKAELANKKEDKTIQYGTCIYPNLKETGYRNSDGYVYVYGHITYHNEKRISLCVARVLPEDFKDWRKWKFFDGKEFVSDIEKSAPLLDHISCEMSVIPIASGANKGKVLAVFQYDTQSNYTAYAVGENLWGPFGEPQKVFYCRENEIAESVYIYNAKAHLHLSYGDKILASYNVNASSAKETYKNGHLYMPRFIELEDTTILPMDKMFDNAFNNRVLAFRKLNKLVDKGASVFVGDSIIQEYPLEELFDEHLPVYNRGIGADTSLNLLQRLDESIFELEPSKIFMLIGTNDFPLYDCSEMDIVDNITKCVIQIKKRIPNCKIHILSILPINNSKHHKIMKDVVVGRSNEKTKKTNTLLKKLAEKEKIKYIDLYTKLLDEKNNLAIKYTKEGLHLTIDGYKVITDIIKEYLE